MLSQKLVQVNKCANFECQNQLTSYELKKLEKFKSKALNKYNFCRLCRYRLGCGILQYTSCTNCGNPVNFESWKKYCRVCKDMIQKEQDKTRFKKYSKKKLWATKKDWIIFGLKRQPLNKGMLMSLTKCSSWGALRMFMMQLRQDGHVINFKIGRAHV